jgi:hypothetical protein
MRLLQLSSYSRWSSFWRCKRCIVTWRYTFIFRYRNYGWYYDSIESNTTIPTKKISSFSTAADSQPTVELHVLQGARVAADNKLSVVLT